MGVGQQTHLSVVKKIRSAIAEVGDGELIALDRSGSKAASSVPVFVDGRIGNED